VDQPAGACTGGAKRYPYELGGSICVAESSCPWPAERCGGCQTVESFINYNARWGRVRLEGGFAIVHDGPRDLCRVDAYGRAYPLNSTVPIGDWTYQGCGRNGQLCPPRRTTCPSPPPSTPPTPPPPGPTPNPGPTPASCPDLVCLYVCGHNGSMDSQTGTCNGEAHLHNIVVDNQPAATPQACERGCWVVIDSTPLFGVCLARGRCNGEQVPDGCGGRECEQPDGYAWSQVGGPSVPWQAQNGDNGRGYQIKVDTTQPGRYAFRECKAGPVDALGVPVATSGPECSVVEFDVH